MDTFTQRMLNRATSRKVEFEQHMQELLSVDNDIDDPNLEIMLEAKRREYREILRSGNRFPSSADNRNDDYETAEDKENVTGKNLLSKVTKTRLKNLVPIYTGDDPGDAFPSPVGYGRRQAERELNECENNLPPGKLSEERSKRLARLATVINNWEDESDKKLQISCKTDTTTKPVLKPVSSPALQKKIHNFDKSAAPKSTPTPKKVVWDDTVLQSLEMQGFQRCESDQHLVFDYKSPQKSPADCSRDVLRCNISSPSKVTVSVEIEKTRPTSTKKYPAPQPPSPSKVTMNVRQFEANSGSPIKSRPDSPSKFRPENTSKYCSDNASNLDSNSPTMYRSRSPTKLCSESPTKFRSASPTKFGPESPTKFRSASPTKFGPESPTKFRSASPTKFGPESPSKFRSESPTKFLSESPTRFRPESPTKFVSESPSRFRSASPTKLCPSAVNSRPESPTKHFQTAAMILMQETLPVRRCDQVDRNKSQFSTQREKFSPTKSTSGSAVMEIAAKYEHETSPPKKFKDPTELSVHDRKAIFERNNGGAILPKAPFGMPVPAKVLLHNQKAPSKYIERASALSHVEWKKENADVDAKDSVTRSILERQKEIEMLRNRWEKKREENVMQGGPSAKFPPQYSNSNERDSVPPPPPMPSQTTTPNKIKMGTRSPVRKERSREPSPIRSPILSPKYVHKRSKSPEGLSNCVNNQVPLSPRKSTEMIGNASGIKKIKVSPPKPGRLYPSISDIETESEALETESEVHESDFDVVPSGSKGGYYYSESDESGFSLGQAVVQRARLSQINLKRGMTTSSLRSSDSSTTSPDTSAQESRILHEMDDFLDEALGDVSPPKRSRDGFSTLQGNSDKMHLQSNDSASCHSDSFEFQNKKTEDFMEKKPPLVHTVSTYRKMEAQRTPKKELFEMDLDAEAGLKVETPENVLAAERMFELEQEMIKQTTIISQASQALNLCEIRPEFSGSMEQVEAEKLLLLATTRRMAAQHEVERLKVEKTLKPGGLKNNTDKGNLTIEYLSLPIKMCPTEPEKTDYFLCLVTSGVTVQSTQVLPLKKQNLTRGNRLAFTKPITLDNLYCDFTVSIEVYRMSCKNSSVHIGGPGLDDKKEDKKLASKLRLTPQKKSNPRRNNRIPIESPGGPNSVRSPSFKMVGFVVFSLREVRRNKFTLNKVPYGVPLDGTIELSMSSALKSEIEYKGFLTQFEEVSGFGAWKRKWALLKGSTITLWLYPEHEEQNKIPIDTLDLGTVRNKEVGLVSREICARPHTFMLETDCGEKKLLSADTMDDRLAWTKAINKSLQLIRAWGGRPY